jgi:TonB family protein
MRKTLSFLAILTLTAAIPPSLAHSQQDPAQDQTTTAPIPGKDGVYQPGPGIDPPYLTSPAMATYPDGATSTDIPAIVRFTAVIAADGSLQSLTVIHPARDAYDAAATAAIRQSKFAPGALNGNPVPVLVCIRVPFFHLRPAIPRLQNCPQPGDLGAMQNRNALRLPPGSKPPRPIYQPNPEYSDQARKKKIQGTVLITLTVDEQGQPTDLHIEKSLGYGLDEKALDCVSQYRFQPATKPDGTPVPAHIAIEINFRLY